MMQSDECRWRESHRILLILFLSSHIISVCEFNFFFILVEQDTLYFHAQDKFFLGPCYYIPIL